MKGSTHQPRYKKLTVTLKLTTLCSGQSDLNRRSAGHSQRSDDRRDRRFLRGRQQGPCFPHGHGHHGDRAHADGSGRQFNSIKSFGNFFRNFLADFLFLGNCLPPNESHSIDLQVIYTNILSSLTFWQIFWAIFCPF